MIINVSTDFIDGYKSAIQDVKDGGLYDLANALLMFELDPPDSETQRGYHYGVKIMYNKQKERG
tara:strand:+ start:898 stop:1089 length:192 start_codon:yes stop_codon:yes gene_type:complete